MPKRARASTSASETKAKKKAATTPAAAAASPDSFKGTNAELDTIARSRLILKDSVVGTDASVTRCVQAFMPFARSVTRKRGAGDGPGVQQLAHVLLGELDRFGLAIARARRITRASSSELDVCADRQRDITKSVAVTREDISRLKQELHVARTVRHNKEDLEALAKLVSDETDRDTITAEMEELQRELDRLQSEGSASAARIFELKSQCQLFMHALQDMRVDCDAAAKE